MFVVLPRKPPSTFLQISHAVRSFAPGGLSRPKDPSFRIYRPLIRRSTILPAREEYAPKFPRRRHRSRLHTSLPFQTSPSIMYRYSGPPSDTSASARRILGASAKNRESSFSARGMFSARCNYRRRVRTHRYTILRYSGRRLDTAGPHREPSVIELRSNPMKIQIGRRTEPR